MEEFNQSVIYFIPRVILGILFFFQAYDKIFTIKLAGVFNTLETEYNRAGLPDWFLKFSIFVSSLIELTAGFLLILGLFTPIALYLLGFNMIMVALGFSYLRPLWDMRHFFPRLVLLLILVFLPSSWDIWSVDNLVNYFNN